jgi:large subunit ribosomal protein L16
MSFIPKKLKYKKHQKGCKSNFIAPIRTLNNLKFKSLIIKAESFGRISSTQLTAFANSLKKRIKRVGRVIFKVFAHTPVSKKPLEVRMGKGKGPVDYWVTKVRAGSILCEIEIYHHTIPISSFRVVLLKLPIKTKIELD